MQLRDYQKALLSYSMGTNRLKLLLQSGNPAVLFLPHESLLQFEWFCHPGIGQSGVWLSVLIKCFSERFAVCCGW